MFRKLDDKEANEVLEDIREKVSGEAGAEAYNFLLKAKENGWDFSKTYKQTADGQSESDFESERKEQSKKLARTIEKLIEEDAELSQKLNYKDYMAKKENKTASLNVEADGNLEPFHFITNTNKGLNFWANSDYLVDLVNKSGKANFELTRENILDWRLKSDIHWDLKIDANLYGINKFYASVPDQVITVLVRYYQGEDDFEINLDILLTNVICNEPNNYSGGFFLSN